MLSFSTFLGGEVSDYGYDIALDNFSNVYVTGVTQHTTSVPFPNTHGAYDNSHNGSYDAFMAKLHFTGSSLEYSTFLGGVDDEAGNGLSIDNLANVYLTGNNYSSGFPVSPGSFDNTHNGNYDAFLTKFNSSGLLAFSTFIGGVGDETGSNVVVNSVGEPFVVGHTASSDFPTVSGCHDETHNGDHDIFLVRFLADGYDLIYSTFLGGSNNDYGYTLH